MKLIPRSKERIQPFLDKLGELWLLYPDYRFGQLISMIHDLASIRSGDPYDIEDEAWHPVLQELIDEELDYISGK